MSFRAQARLVGCKSTVDCILDTSNELQLTQDLHVCSISQDALLLYIELLLEQRR